MEYGAGVVGAVSVNTYFVLFFVILLAFFIC